MNESADVLEPGGREHPWPDVATARRFLRSLVYSTEPSMEPGSGIVVADLTRWLAREGLASLAYRRYRSSWPELAEGLRGDYYVTAATNSLHMQRLDKIASLFSGEGIPVVLLKGAALSHAIYGDTSLRPMSDLDLWLREEDMPGAIRLLSDAGYVLSTKEDRPPALQRIAGGEVALHSPERGLVELHWAPFSGWWLHYTARVDDAALWRRLEIVEPATSHSNGGLADSSGEAEPVRWQRLSTEDMILHLAWHLGVNHQYGLWPIRSLVDIAMIVRRETVNWETLIRRARAWQLAVVLWSVLEFTEQLISSEELTTVLQRLQPSGLRRRLLGRWISTEILLRGEDLSKRAARYPIMLLLVDRPKDLVRLVFRTLWPERSWLDARYGAKKVSRWGHLWRVMRHRGI